MAKTLGDLLTALNRPSPEEWERVPVFGISDDSRCLRTGDVFVAIPGLTHDGADYVQQAVHRGAVAVVCERKCDVSIPTLLVEDAREALAALAAAFYDHPTRDLFTIGVTGTNGKTTVCHLSSHLLGEERTGLIGTVANEARGGLRGVTTPTSPTVQRIAREAKEGGKENLVIEASSIGLAQHRLDHVDFDVAAFTNLSRDHYDLHRDREGYLRAKELLFRRLNPDAWAVINTADPVSHRILAVATGRALTYAIEGGGDLTVSELHVVERSSSFRVHWGKARADVDLPLPGRHNVENALAGCRQALRAAQHGLHPADKLSRAKGLGHIIVRSQFQPAHLVPFFIPNRQHDHGDVRDLAQCAQRLKAIQFGHHHVE